MRAFSKRVVELAIFMNPIGSTKLCYFHALKPQVYNPKATHELVSHMAAAAAARLEASRLLGRFVQVKYPLLLCSDPSFTNFFDENTFFCVHMHDLELIWS